MTPTRMRMMTTITITPTIPTPPFLEFMLDLRWGKPGSSVLFLSGSLIPDHVPERFNRAIDATNALQPGARNQHEGERH